MTYIFILLNIILNPLLIYYFFWYGQTLIQYYWMHQPFQSTMNYIFILLNIILNPMFIFLIFFLCGQA